MVNELSTSEYVKFTLTSKTELSHNTALFPFSFTPEMELGMSVISSLTMQLPCGDGIIRPYTPISSLSQRGHVDLITGRVN